MAFLLAACGGVSKEDYAQKLDEICADVERQTAAIGDSQPASPDELSQRLDQIRATTRRGIERMKKVERPDGEAGGTAATYLSELEGTLNQQVLPALDEFERAARSKSQARIRAAATRLQAINEEKSRRLAEDLGADECARPR